MFGQVKKVCKNIIKLQEGKILKDVLRNTSLQQDIIDLNRDDQLYDKGIRADGQSLGEYHAITIGKKIEKGQRYDHVTLKDTGEFYESFKIKNNENEIIITADAEKPDGNLAFIYGKQILGLTKENLAVVRGWIKPIFLRKTREKIAA